MVTRVGQGRIVLLIVGLGMFLGLIGPELRAMETWEPLTKPPFWGQVLIQVGVVIGAWIAGQLSPGGKVAQSVSNVITGSTGTGDGTKI